MKISSLGRNKFDIIESGVQYTVPWNKGRVVLKHIGHYLMLLEPISYALGHERKKL